MNDEFDYADDGQDEKSKSQRKREMTALQDMGKELAEMSEARLAQFPLTEDLRLALREYQHIRKNEAKRRQLQYIGKLMRSEDQEGIAAVFERFANQRRQAVQHEHLAEQWRERLLEGEAEAVTRFVDEYPQTDRQEFRNLLRNAINEREAGKSSNQTRKLFRFLRETIAQHS